MKKIFFGAVLCIGTLSSSTAQQTATVIIQNANIITGNDAQPSTQ